MKEKLAKEKEEKKKAQELIWKINTGYPFDQPNWKDLKDEDNHGEKTLLEALKKVDKEYLEFLEDTKQRNAELHPWFVFYIDNERDMARLRRP